MEEYIMNIFKQIYYFARASWYLSVGRWFDHDEYIAHKIAWEIVFEGKHKELIEGLPEELKKEVIIPFD
jgi:hypothetical protein